MFSNYVHHPSPAPCARAPHRQSSNCIACIDFSAVDNNRHFIAPNGVSRAARLPLRIRLLLIPSNVCKESGNATDMKARRFNQLSCWSVITPRSILEVIFLSAPKYTYLEVYHYDWLTSPSTVDMQQAVGVSHAFGILLWLELVSLNYHDETDFNLSRGCDGLPWLALDRVTSCSEEWC